MKQKAEYTPGPWEVVFSSHWSWGIRAIKGIVVKGIRRQTDANLMGAAPDLLAACELAKQHLDAMRLESGMGNVLLPFEKAAFEQVDDVLTAAIAKAKGDQCSV